MWLLELFFGGLGIYQYLVDFAGAGATVPLTGFGYNLAKGAIEAVKQSGLVGAFTGGVKAASGGIAAAVFFGYLASLISKAKNEKNNKCYNITKLCAIYSSTTNILHTIFIFMLFLLFQQFL